jgi:hypothetical protein
MVGLRNAEETPLAGCFEIRSASQQAAFDRRSEMAVQSVIDISIIEH